MREREGERERKEEKRRRERERKREGREIKLSELIYFTLSRLFAQIFRITDTGT